MGLTAPAALSHQIAHSGHQSQTETYGKIYRYAAVSAKQAASASEPACTAQFLATLVLVVETSFGFV